MDENVPAKSTTIEFSFPTYPRYENSTKFIIPGRKEENIGSRPVRKSVETLTDPESRGVNPGISVQTQTSGLGENPRTFGDFSSNISADSKHFSETCTVVADFGKQIVLTNTNSEHLVSTATQSKKSATPSSRPKSKETTANFTTYFPQAKTRDIATTPLGLEKGSQKNYKNELTKEGFQQLKEKETIPSEVAENFKPTCHCINTKG